MGNKLNQQEIERVQDAPSLYKALQEAQESNTEGLSKQVYYRYRNDNNSTQAYLRYTNKRLNYLVYRMKKKYADAVNSVESVSMDDKKYGASMDKKAFEEHEIDDMMINFIYGFNERFVEIAEHTVINVPSIEAFKAEDELHSNNKLIKYIVGSRDKKGMFELALLQALEIKRDTKRFMKNGVSQKVDLNDMSVVGMDDIITHSDDEESNVNIEELMQIEEKGSYQATKEMQYIKDNLKNVLTKNQYEKFNMLVSAVKKGDVELEDLFHDVSDKLILSKLGSVWFPEKKDKNNYIQPAVKKLLDSIRRRMSESLEQQGLSKESNIRSTYRKLKNHSMEENKLFNDYKIWEKYVIRDLEIDEFNNNIGNFKNEEQFIKMEEVEKIMNKEQTVADVINKHGLTKKHVDNKNGAVKHYVIDNVNGKPLFTDEEIKVREDKHCKQLLNWIREQRIVFTQDEQDSDLMHSNNHKLHSINKQDYYRLVERSLLLKNEKKELEIVRKYMNRKYFNADNKYVLKEVFYVDEDGKKYMDLKRYNDEEEYKNIAI